MCRIDVVIVLLLPPRSVIGSLFEGKIWSMVSRLPSSVNKIALRARQHGETQAVTKQLTGLIDFQSMRFNLNEIKLT